MRTKSILTLLVMTAALSSFGFTEAKAGFPGPPGVPNVNVQVNGYLPAPPGVYVQMDSGRPYYVERDRRVYIERERPAKHYKEKHYKKAKKNHEDNGYKNGHYKEDKHDH